jgi:hypothetical protein
MTSHTLSSSTTSLYICLRISLQPHAVNSKHLTNTRIQDHQSSRDQYWRGSLCPARSGRPAKHSMSPLPSSKNTPGRRTACLPRTSHDDVLTSIGRRGPESKWHSPHKERTPPRTGSAWVLPCGMHLTAQSFAAPPPSPFPTLFLSMLRTPHYLIYTVSHSFHKSGSISLQSGCQETLCQPSPGGDWAKTLSLSGSEEV